MNLIELAGRGLEVQGETVNTMEGKATIIACTPIVKMPMTVRMRVVLVAIPADKNYNGKLVVWNQGFEDNNHYHFGTGDYFDPHNFVKAMKRFAERAERFAEHCESIMR